MKIRSIALIFLFLGGTLCIFSQSLDYRATFVSQNVPECLNPGQQYQVQVVFRNAGLLSWTKAGQIKLGSQNPQDNLSWGFGRVDLPDGVTILPAHSFTFEFTITAPTTPGSYNFQWRMVKEGVCWFGDSTPNVAVEVNLGCGLNSQLLSQSIPQTVYVGQQFPIRIEYKNTGTKSWSQADMIRLGSQDLMDNWTWGLYRVDLLPSEIISKDATKIFTFIATAPQIPKTYNCRWGMLREDVRWFGPFTDPVTVNVISRPDFDAQFISQSIPENMGVGLETEISLTFRNTGTREWSTANGICLGTGAQNSICNERYINLETSESILPGQDKTFTFTITAPVDLGPYYSQWAMFRENRIQFGDDSPLEPIYNMQLINPIEYIRGVSEVGHSHEYGGHAIFYEPDPSVRKFWYLKDPRSGKVWERFGWNDQYIYLERDTSWPWSDGKGCNAYDHKPYGSMIRAKTQGWHVGGKISGSTNTVGFYYQEDPIIPRDSDWPPPVAYPCCPSKCPSYPLSYNVKLIYQCSQQQQLTANKWLDSPMDVIVIQVWSQSNDWVERFWYARGWGWIGWQNVDVSLLTGITNIGKCPTPQEIIDCPTRPNGEAFFIDPIFNSLPFEDVCPTMSTNENCQGILFQITVQAGTGGSITPSESVLVAQGINQTFSITPASGYSICDVQVDHVSQGAISSYTFENIQANSRIEASFLPSTFSITAVAGNGGTISPAGSVPVIQGANQTFTISANSGYGVQGVVVDGVAQGAITSYTFNNVQTGHTIAATFVQAPTYYVITASAGTGGTISPAGSVSVVQGANPTFTIAAYSGYGVQGVTVDGVAQGAITSYSFSNVQANHSIVATFTSMSAIPLGAIVPFDSDAAIPSGWTQFTAANGKYLVGAGGTFAVGATGGGGIITIGSTTNGQHTGSSAWAGVGNNTGGVRTGGGPAGGHMHNVSFTPALGNRQMRFLKASTQQDTFPADTLVLATQNLSGLINTYTDDNRYLVPANAKSVTSSSIGTASCSTSGAHQHASYNGGNAPDWSWVDYPCFDEGPKGNHSHTVSVSLATDNVQKAYVTAWTNASAAFGASSRMIVMYESLTPPPGWVICDGTNGTVDLRNYFVFLGPATSQGTKTGNNTLTIADNIASHSWTHDHITYCSWANPVSFPEFQHSSGNFPHSHDLTGHSPAYQPPYYALVFIQKQ